MNKVEASVGEDIPDGLRVDKFISEHLSLFSRSQIRHRNTKVWINGKEAKLSGKVSFGDKIVVEYEDLQEPGIVPEPLPLDIIYENADVIVLNKSQGMVVHPAAGNYSGTLVQGLLYHYKNHGENFNSELIRPGIVHRLDKDTSGVIIAARNPESQEYLSSQFRKKTTKKMYLAIVKGVISEKEGTVEGFLSRDPKHRKKFTWKTGRGKAAKTRYRVLTRWKESTFVALYPETGRTHQLRVHMLSIRHPIVGDPLYSRNPGNRTLMLHAYRLKIRLPREECPRQFRAPMPNRFKRYIIEKRGKVD